ncbi:hypothetical protein PAXINDRAFT_57618, partial [Paxillus involutus ATCC 200175]
QLWHMYVTQSILYGIGSSMYYFPIMSLTPIYFEAHRGFAMGLIFSGSGAGTPVVNSIIARYGIGWALRILGIWNLVVGIPVACVIRKRRGFGRGDTRVGLGLVKKGTSLYQVGWNLFPRYLGTSFS